MTKITSFGKGIPAKQYAAEVAERNKARIEEKAGKPVFPNLAQAQAEFNPTRDGFRTMDEIAAEQKVANAPKAPGISQETVEGLKALHEATRATEQRAAEQERAQAPQQAEAAPAVPNPQDDFADADIVDMFRRIKEDPINNERERKAVEARVSPIDLARGILNSEFTQLVPIVPGVFEVTFRSLNVMEHQGLRLMLFREIEANPEMEQISGEVLGFYQTVASVQGVNDSQFKSHMVTNSSGLKEFSEEEFKRKLATFRMMPLHMIGAMGVHGSWFDLRVRQLFSSADALKNG